MSRQPRQVVLVVFDGMQLLNVLGPAEVFDAANRVLEDRPGYSVLVASRNGRAVRSSPGLRIASDAALAHVRARGLDTLIVAGGMDIHDVSRDPRLTDELCRLSAGARRTCSVCTGAFLLAEAGLLNGRRATTHWAFCAQLARKHPEVSVEPDRIFVRDGATTTSAGASAGIDLALALVQEDHGADVARKVARWLVVFLQRPGGQSQFSERLSLPATTNSHVGPAARAVLGGGRPFPSGICGASSSSKPTRPLLGSSSGCAWRPPERCSIRDRRRSRRSPGEAGSAVRRRCAVRSFE